MIITDPFNSVKFYTFLIISPLLISLFIGTTPEIRAQSNNIVYQAEDREFILSNDLFERKIQVSDLENTISTTSFRLSSSGHQYIQPETREFSLSVNGKTISGRDGFFKITDYTIENPADRSILEIELTGIPGTPAENLLLKLYYEEYDDLPMVRKWMQITNSGPIEMRIENVFVEDLFIDPGDFAGSDIFKTYGREWTKPPFIGGKDDPSIFIRGRSGSFITGNEGPGMMKYTSLYQRLNEIRIGLNPVDHAYPFRRYLSKNESFKSPEVFIILTMEADPAIALEKLLGRYLRNHLGIKLYKREIPPVFLYNTWNPFRININDKLIRELADALENTGIEYLIIDDGWQDHNGDWNVNRDKFPDGLKPVTDYIRQKGMKPGLWISLTIAEKESEAFQEYQDLAVVDVSGNPANLHGWSNNLEILTMKIASPWYDHIKKKMRALILDYGIQYFKIDLGMVKSAYIMEMERSGSYDANEQFNGREEYLYIAFEKTNQLFDELAAEFPELIIDCTFELWGDWHMIDYALVKHADVDWISNFEAPPPEGSRTVRQLAYHHGLAVPTSCMVIGNQKLEAENHELSFISNLASTPIMLGDPRQLNPEEKAWYKKMSTWLEKMHRNYQIFKFYQTSVVFDVPTEHNWDGFARFNPDADGGIVCIFRNDQKDTFRTFTLPWCNQENRYMIIDAESNKELGKFSGKELMDFGIKVQIDRIHSARVFEIKPLGKGGESELSD